MDNLNSQKVTSTNSVFSNNFLDAKHLYLYWFNNFPSVSYIDSIDGEKAFAVFKEKYAEQIEKVYQYRLYKRKKKQYDFNTTIVVLKTKIILTFDDDYCDIYYDSELQQTMKEITEVVIPFKERQRHQPFEINLIVQNGREMYLKAMETKRVKLDLSLFYEDDFKIVDEIIRKRLNQRNDKGIVLLHGLPGTGKTTYLRYLIGKIKKRVLFLSPNVAGDLMNPDFIDLLIDNPNTVVVIEDAENIIMDRRSNSGSAVSNLLNISDGLLADFLNVQLICTFNSSLTLVDSALMRKGRLIAKYEFGKLSIEKAQQLSNHLGFNTVIKAPMTVAEISNQHEQNFDTKQVQVIGFRREEMLQN